MEGPASAARKAKLCLTIVNFLFINYVVLVQHDRIFDNTKFISAQGEAGLLGVPGSPGQKGDKGEQVRHQPTLSGQKRIRPKVTSQLCPPHFSVSHTNAHFCERLSRAVFKC